nr:TPA_asm: hypothetical protein [Phagomor virus 4]
MDSFCKFYPTVERRETVSATTDKCESALTSFECMSAALTSNGSESIRLTSSECMSAVLTSNGSDSIHLTSSECMPAVSTSNGSDSITQLVRDAFPVLSAPTTTVCKCMSVNCGFTDTETPHDVSTLVAPTNSAFRRESEPLAQGSIPVQDDEIYCDNGEPMTASKPEVHARVIDMSLTQQSNRAESLVLPNTLRSRMSDLDYELSTGPIIRENRYVSCLFDQFYNVRMSVSACKFGNYLSVSFNHLPMNATVYIYRNSIRIGHLSTVSSFFYSLNSSTGLANFDSCPQPDFPSPYKTDCFYIDSLPLSRLYTRYLAPDSSITFSNISRDKLQMPVTCSLTDSRPSSASLRQFSIFDVPEYSDLFLQRYGETSLFLSLTLKHKSSSRPLAQLDGLPTTVITPGEVEPADKFPVSFKRTAVHRHIVALCSGLQKPFWKFILNLDEIIVMKYACVMADVLHEYCDFSQPELAIQLFSLRLTPRQILNRTCIIDCLWGRVNTAELLATIQPPPLAQGWGDFTFTHKTDLAEVGKELLKRVDYMGSRLCDVQKLFETSAYGDFKTHLRVFLVSLVSNIYIMTHDINVGVRIAACVNIINTIPSGSDSALVSALMRGLMTVSTFFDDSKSNAPCAQSDKPFPSEGILTSLVQVIVGFLKSSDDKLVRIEDFRVKRLINLLKLSSFTCNASNFAQTLYVKAMDVVNVYLFGVKNTDAFYASLHGDLPAWFRGCLRFELTVDDDDKVEHPIIELTKYENKLALIRHVAEGERILKILVASDALSRYSRVINYMTAKLNNLRKLMITVGATLVGMQGKHSPFVVYVYGKPGLGKSMMVDFFLTGMYACSEEKYDPCLDKFSKSATTQYWNGYDSHKVFLIDDFLQSKSEEACNESLADLIALGSRAPFPLNKADVDSKGTSFFNSEVVMITAQNEFSSAYYERFVQSGRAITRRLDVVIEVVGKSDMLDSTGKIDVSKVGVGFNPNACLYNLKTDNFTKQNLSFADCVIECAVLRCAKKVVESNLDECKLTEFDWKTKFIERRNVVQMFDPESSFQDILSNTDALLNQFNDPTLPDSRPDFVYEGGHNYGLPTETLAANDLIRFDDYYGKFLTDSVNFSVISDTADSCPSNPLHCDDSLTDHDSSLLREVDEASIVRALREDNEPNLITKYAKAKWYKIRSKMHEAICAEREILQLYLDRQRVRDLFKSKLIVGFLSTQAVLLSIFALYKIFTHFRRKSANVPKDTLQKTLNVAVHARENEQTRNVAEAREFRENDIAWLYTRALRLAEEQGLDLKSIVREEDVPQVRATLKKSLDAALTDRLNNDVESNELVCDAEIDEVLPVPDYAVKEPTYAEVARAIRRAKYVDGDPTKPRKQRRVLRQALEMTAYDDLKLKVSKFDDARNTELIAQLTSEDFIEDCCECCERYYLYERDCMNPLECPYADCETNRERTNKPDRLQLHHMSRGVLLAEILEKSRYGLPMCESARDPELMSILELTRNNLVRVRNKLTGCTLCGLIVDSDILCFPLHLFVGSADYKNACLEINSTVMQKYVVCLSDTTFYADESRDIMFVQLIKYPLRRSLVKFFHRNSDRIEYYDAGYIAKISENNCLTLLSINSIEIKAKFEYFFSDNPTDSRRCVIDNHANYNADTMVGDCGAPVFYVNRAFSRKILGIHVAGSVGKGMSNILSQEYLEETLERFKRFNKAQVDCEGFYDCSRLIRSDDVVTLLGRVECGLGKPGNTQTAFVPSLIHDSVRKHTTEPCMLVPDGDIDPLRMGIVKAFKPDISFPKWMLDAATADVLASVRTLQSPYSRVGLLTDHQNINGDFNLHRIEGINLNSSAGYPWNLYALDGKKRFFYGDEHDLTMMPLLQKTFTARENDLKQGLIPPFIVTDTLKDERRPIAKVRTGKTRVFSAGPIDMTLLVRKYYGSFVAHLMDNCVLGECSVGLNVHGDDWGMMYEHLRSVGDHWIAGDYAAFDKRLPYQIMMAVCDVTNAWYNDGPENQRVREGLMISMASSTHLADHVLYEVHHGMPSGVPITAVGNSVANSIMFRLAFIDIATELFGETKALQLFSDFNSFVRLVAYGDDHILRVSDSVKWFNMVSISAFFARYGMEYTTTSKVAAVEEFVSDTDLQYLCRKFVYREGRWWAPLEMDTIYEMLNWVRKCPMGEHLSLQTNIDMALIEMSHYPKEAWQAFYNRLVTELVKKRIAVPRLTYQICLKLVSGYVFDPAYLLGIEQSITGSRPVVETAGATNQIFLRKIQQAIRKHYGTEHEDEIILPTQLRRTTLADATVIVVPRKNKLRQPPRPVCQVGPAMSNDIDRANVDDPVTKSGLTNFSDQSGKVIIENEAVMGKVPGLTVYGSQTLQEFIERPYLISQITWKSTDVGTIASLEFPTELFNVKSLSEKLACFRYMRADVEISIRVNASKFHYGKLMAVWKPMLLNGLVDWTTTKLPDAYQNYISSSGFQHIFISPTSNEVQTLLVPYAIPPLYIDLADWAGKTNIANVRYNLGNLEFHVLSALSCSGKVPDVDISVFARFVDVQLEAYVGEPFSVASYAPTDYPKAKLAPVITGYCNLFGGNFAKKEPVTHDRDRPIAQVGNPEANRKSSSASLSSVLTGGAALIGSITAAATLIGKFSGMSLDKPVSTETPKNVIERYSEFSLTKGVSNAMLLAADPDNRVGDITRWMGSETSHQNLARYGSRYGILYQSTIKVTDTAGCTYCYAPVCPVTVPYLDSEKIRYVYHNPLSFVASMFTWWRGSMKYRIQVVASAFHACRLRIAWQPVLPVSTARASILEYESNVISHVLDISTDTEFEFTIPYLNDDPALGLQPGSQNCNGYVSITLINTLTHSSDPVPDVNFILWVAGGDDMEFFRPSTKLLSNIGFGSKIPKERPLAQVDQAIDSDRTNESLAPATIGVLNNMICGERMVNFSDVIKRPCVFIKGIAEADGAVGKAMSPYYMQDNKTKTMTPFLAYAMGGFRFWRGSFVCNVIKSNAATYYALNRYLQFDGAKMAPGTAIKFDDVWKYFGQSIVYSPTSSLAPCEVAMPYYSNALFQPINFLGYFTVATTIPYVYLVTKVAQTDDLFTISAGDDFALGGIIGPPCLQVDSAVWK